MANTGLIGKIAGLFKHEKASPQNPADMDKRGLSTETSPGDVSQFWDQVALRWRVDPDRKNTWLDIENMDANDEIVSQALDVLADAATGKLDDSTVESFYFSSDNLQVLKILNEMTDRLGLKEKATDICRKMVKHGNEFREIIVAPYRGSFHVVRLKEDLPAYQFISNRDQFGNVNPDAPWIQREDGTITGRNDIQFKPWQLVHWHYGEMHLGTAIPKLKSARRNWKRLCTVEDSMAQARMNRAYSKLIHRVPVEDSDDDETQGKKVARYKQLIQKKEFLSWATGQKGELENPLTVETDFFLPDDGSGRGGIETIDPKNNQLSDIPDVNYALNRLIARLGVPRKYLSIPEEGGKMNSSAGDNEEKQFARQVRNIQMAFRHGLRIICNLELILQEIDPLDPKNTFLIEMAEVNGDDQYRQAQRNMTNAAAAERFLKMFDMPEEVYLRKFMQLSDYEIKQYGSRIKLRPWPNPAYIGGDPSGSAEKGQKPGSSDNNGKSRPRKPQQ
jgi:Bacteriophage T4-like portal protein (Gp20)